MQVNLSNPRPSLGDSAPFARVTPENPPRPRSDMSIPGAPTLHNVVEYQQTNPTFNAMLPVRKYSNGIEKYITEGDLIWVNPKGTSKIQHSSRRPPSVVANLQMMNTLLARTQENPQDSLSTPSNWTFFGVMQSEMQLNGGTQRPNTVRSGNDKVLSVQVRGRSVRVKNYWPNSSALDSVGFVVGSVLSAEMCNNPRLNAQEKRYCNFAAQNFKLDYVIFNVDGTLNRDAIGKLLLNQPLPRSLQNLAEELDLDEATFLNAYNALQEILNEDLELPRREEYFQKLKKLESAMLTRTVPQGPLMWIPFNFTQQDISILGDNIIHVKVGVISDTFHQPMASTTAVTRDLTQLDPRPWNKRPGIPMCELFVRVH